MRSTASTFDKRAVGSAGTDTSVSCRYVSACATIGNLPPRVWQIGYAEAAINRGMDTYWSEVVTQFKSTHCAPTMAMRLAGRVVGTALVHDPHQFAVPHTGEGLGSAVSRSRTARVPDSPSQQLAPRVGFAGGRQRPRKQPLKWPCPPRLGGLISRLPLAVVPFVSY